MEKSSFNLQLSTQGTSSIVLNGSSGMLYVAREGGSNGRGDQLTSADAAFLGSEIVLTYHVA